jgi:O-antigen/teichoic acid export membrane protein
VQTTRRVFWNTAVLLASEAGRLLAGVALVVAIGRILGSEALGTFTYAMALVGILGVVGDFGLSAFYVRTAQHDGRPALLGVVLGLRIAAGAVAVAVMIVLAWLARSDQTVALLLVLGAALLAVGIWPSIVIAVLRARQRMAYEGGAKLIGSLASGAGGIGAVLAGWGIVGVAAVMLAVAGATFVYFAWLAPRVLVGPVSPVQPWTAYREALRGIWPFASLAVLVVVYFRIDSVMLFAMKGPEVLGQYGAAYRVMEAGLLIPITLAGTALPAVARWLGTRADEVLAAGTRAIHFLAMLAVPATIFGAALGPTLFVALYGPEFAEAGAIFRVLVFTLVPVFASSVTSSLIAGGPRPVVNTYIALLMVVLNIGLNWLLIPTWSGAGAAVATVITEASGLLLGTLYIRRAIGPFPYAGEFLKPLLASAAVGVVALRHPSLAAIPLYAGGYFAVLWLVRGLTREDVAFVKRMVMRPQAPGTLQGQL